MNHIKIELDKMQQVLGYAQATLQLPVDHRLVLLDFIPVEERLPEFIDATSNSKQCVLMMISGAWMAGYRAQAGEWRDSQYGARYVMNAVTHWAEIPEIG